MAPPKRQSSSSSSPAGNLSLSLSQAELSMAPPKRQSSSSSSSAGNANALLPLPGLAVGVIAGIVAAIVSHTLLRKEEKKKDPSPPFSLKEPQNRAFTADEEQDQTQQGNEDGFSEQPLLSSVGDPDFKPFDYANDDQYSQVDSALTFPEIPPVSIQGSLHVVLSNEDPLESVASQMQFHGIENDIKVSPTGRVGGIKVTHELDTTREREINEGERETEELNGAHVIEKRDHVSQVALCSSISVSELALEVGSISTCNTESEIDPKHYDIERRTNYCWINNNHDPNLCLRMDGSKTTGHMVIHNENPNLQLSIDGSETVNTNIGNETYLNQSSLRVRAEEPNDSRLINYVESFDGTFSGMENCYESVIESFDNYSEEPILQPTIKGSNEQSNLEVGLDETSINFRPATKGLEIVAEKCNFQPTLEGLLNCLEKPDIPLIMEKSDTGSEHLNLEESDNVNEKAENGSENLHLLQITENSDHCSSQPEIVGLHNLVEKSQIQPTIERFDKGGENPKLQATIGNGIEYCNPQVRIEEEYDNCIEKPNIHKSMSQCDYGSEKPNPHVTMNGFDNGSGKRNIQPTLDDSCNTIGKPDFQSSVEEKCYGSEEPSIRPRIDELDNSFEEPNLQSIIEALDNDNENVRLQSIMEVSDHVVEKFDLSLEDFDELCLLHADDIYPVIKSTAEASGADRGFEMQTIISGLHEAHSSIGEEPNLQSVDEAFDGLWKIDTHDTSSKHVDGCHLQSMLDDTCANRQPHVHSIEATLGDSYFGVYTEEIKLHSTMETNYSYISDNGEHSCPLVLEGSEYIPFVTDIKPDLESVVKGCNNNSLSVDEEVNDKSTIACLKDISWEQEYHLPHEVEEYVGEQHVEVTENVTNVPYLCTDDHAYVPMAIESFDETCSKVNANLLFHDDPNIQLAIENSSDIYVDIGAKHPSLTDCGNDTGLTSNGHFKYQSIMKHSDACDNDASSVQPKVEERGKFCFVTNNKVNFQLIDSVSRSYSMQEKDDDSSIPRRVFIVQPIIEFDTNQTSLSGDNGVVICDNVPAISNCGHPVSNSNLLQQMDIKGPPNTCSTINGKPNSISVMMDRSSDTIFISDDLQFNVEGFEVSYLSANGMSDPQSTTESVVNTHVSVVNKGGHLESRVKNIDSEHHILKSIIEVLHEVPEPALLQVTVPKSDTVSNEFIPLLKFDKLNSRNDQPILMSMDDFILNNKGIPDDKDELLEHTIIRTVEENNEVKPIITDPVKEHIRDFASMVLPEVHPLKSTGIDNNAVKEPMCNNAIEKRKLRFDDMEDKPSHVELHGVLSCEKRLSNLEDGELGALNRSDIMKIEEALPFVHKNKKNKKRRKTTNKAAFQGTDCHHGIHKVHGQRYKWSPKQIEKLTPHLLIVFVFICLVAAVISIVLQYLELSRPLGQ